MINKKETIPSIVSRWLALDDAINK